VLARGGGYSETWGPKSLRFIVAAPALENGFFRRACSNFSLGERTAEMCDCPSWRAEFASSDARFSREQIGLRRRSGLSGWVDFLQTQSASLNDFRGGMRGPPVERGPGIVAEGNLVLISVGKCRMLEHWPLLEGLP